MPKILGKAEILGIKDSHTELVSVPEWGEDASVYIRVWSTGERDNYEKRYGRNSVPQDESFRAFVTSISVSDQEGNLLFTPADITELAKKNWKAINAIFFAALELNALTQDQKDELKKT